MTKQAQSRPSTSPQRTRWHNALRWWHTTGEPVVLTGMLLIALTIPLLLVLDILSLPIALRGMVGIVWLIGVVLLVRLPRLLRCESRRLLTVAGIAVVALGFILVAGRSRLTLAEPAATAGLTVPAQQAELTFKAPPRVSKEMFIQLLQRGVGGGGPSPAAPDAPELYDIIVSYEIDPAIALAFFAQESQFCTTGICSSHDMKSWGGQRAAFKRERSAGIVRGKYGPFVSFNTWQDSVRDWCELILYRYVGRGLDTVEKAIPVYAPAADNNQPPVYINNVRLRVATWQGRDPGPPAIISVRDYDSNLETALVSEMFLANQLDFQPTWAFHKYMLDEARAGDQLGSPLGESLTISVNGQLYSVQAFANDILYTPIAPVQSQTNWSDVRRLSELMQQSQAQPQPDEQ